ncbi:30S ribosomal protein S6 like protein [Argiope bruennichi]|uniref:30S ribosomal protein S6 like protein n=1 Tax=Argiope bruennichi TaxID=94029 RepID=A0A8T0FNK7_ARGBR|nr:30S ribosomal protein S6 like protein [Argiope bruennichi]
MANLEALKKSQKVDRAAFTKAQNKLTELITLESVDITKLELELNVFKSKTERLEITHSSVLELHSDSEYNTEFEVVQDICDRAIRIETRARKILNRQHNLINELILTTREASTSETTREASTSETTREASTSENTREASTSENTREASTSENTREASTSENTREASTSENTREASTSENTREASTSENTREASTSENTREASTSENTREASTSENTREAIKTSENTREASTSENTREASTSASINRKCHTWSINWLNMSDQMELEMPS